MQEIKLLEPGIYFDLPFKDYLALPYVSKSYLWKLKHSPANAQKPTTVTEDMTFGRAFHTFTMEPHLFKSEFYSIDNEISGNSAISRRQKANAVLSNLNKTFISATGDKSLETLVGMNKSVLTHPDARRYFAHCHYEVTLIFDVVLPSGYKIRVKARVDAIPQNIKQERQGVQIDLKSTRDCTEDGFTREIVKLGYHVQGSLYTDGINILAELYRQRGEAFPFRHQHFGEFVFVAVEKVWPFRIGCHGLTERFHELGQSEYMRLLEVERSCREAKGGPFYPPWQNAGTSTLDVPLYLRPQI